MNKLVELTKLENGNLKIELTDNGKCEAAEIMLGESRPLDIYEWLEWQTGNGWSWVRPEWIAALTDAPILTDDLGMDDWGDVYHVGDVYWYPQYEVKDEAAELVRKGYVIFTKGE